MNPSMPLSEAEKVGNELVSLCKQGKNLEAVAKLYADDIVSTEVMGSPEMPQTIRGKKAVTGKGEWWFANHTIHGGDVRGPFPNGDQFAVYFSYDITPKIGPMAGKRFTMHEVGLYTVRSGKVAEEKFFYSMNMGG